MLFVVVVHFFTFLEYVYVYHFSTASQLNVLTVVNRFC